MNKLIFTVVFALAACSHKEEAKTAPVTAPAAAPAAQPAQPAAQAPTPATGMTAAPAAPSGPRNLARDYVLDQDPGATCAVYHQHEGPALTDSVLCTLTNRHKLWASVDTVNGPALRRVDPPTEEELKAAEAAKAEAAKATAGKKQR